MARPSRGFTVSSPRPPSGTSCPTTGTTEITPSTDTDWFIDLSWSPGVMVGTLQLWYRVNGDPWNFDQQVFNVVPSYEFEIDTNTYASSGDFLEFKAICTDIGGCPDFETVPAGRNVP